MSTSEAEAFRRSYTEATEMYSVLSDLTATLTDAGLPPSEHGGIRGAVLLLVGLWRGERQRADEAEAALRREKSLCAEANDAMQHYAQRASEAETRIERVREMRETMQREHDLGRISLGGYLILLDRVLTEADQ